MKNFNEIIKKIEEETKKISFDQISNSEVGSLLSVLVASKGDANILELGTGTGLSTAYIIKGMQQGAKLITVDNDEKLVNIAKKYLGDISNVSFNVCNGEEIIDALEPNSIDIIFADTWPGKYNHLEETLNLLKVGGFYIIDDMLEQKNWPKGHNKKVDKLIKTLYNRDDLEIAFLNYSTGVYICTKIDNKYNSWDANKYNKHANFVSKLALPLIDLLEPKEGEKILDLGCGDGTLALEILKYGANVECVDLSQEMVKKAKEKGLDAKVMSATNLSYTNKFDAIFSNAVLHWVKDAKLAVKNIAKALKSGGRFITEFGGEGNVKAIVDAMQEVFKNNKEYKEFENPWYFPSVNEYKKLLEDEGFEVDYIKLIPRPTPIDDISNWLELFTNGLTKHLNKEQEQKFRDEVKKLLKPKLYNQKDGWVADYVRIRVKAVKI